MKKLTEYIVCAIENMYIVEMAYDRKKFKDLIDSLSNKTKYTDIVEYVNTI